MYSATRSGSQVSEVPQSRPATGREPHTLQSLFIGLHGSDGVSRDFSAQYLTYVPANLTEVNGIFSLSAHGVIP